jgi:hypothetical protein
MTSIFTVKEQHKQVPKKKQVLFATYLFGLLFNHKDRDSMFLWNTGELLPDYMALHRRRQYSP